MATITDIACASLSAASYPPDWQDMQDVYERLVNAQATIERLLTEDLRQEDDKVRKLEAEIVRLKENSETAWQMYRKAEDECRTLKREQKLVGQKHAKGHNRK